MNENLMAILSILSVFFILFVVQKLIHRFTSVFIIKITSKGAYTIHGAVSKAFLDECADIAREFGIRAGKITGIKSPQGIKLKFSFRIPKDSHQRFRNVFTIYM